MSALDVALVALLLPFALRGWWRGFLREACSLVGLVGGAFAAATFSTEAAKELAVRTTIGPVGALALAVVGLFLAVYLTALLIGFVADRLARALFLGPINSTAGVAFGVAKGAVLMGFALVLLPRVLPDPRITAAIESSRLAPELMRLSAYVIDAGGGFAGGARTQEA
jgi:membrane protein required for colicin V production